MTATSGRHHVRRRTWATAGFLAAILTVASCGGGALNADRGDEEADALAALDLDDAGGAFTVSSPNFGDGDPLPARFTCDSTGISPALRIEGVPSGAVELAVVMDDPDADPTYVHWVVAGLAPDVAALPEFHIPEDAYVARNSAGRTNFDAPCPPKGDGAHTYRISVYALDEVTVEKDFAAANASDALELLTERASARATLTATYQRAG
jgi:Raf kinase inhibitor-like YbhB/YbcL family protein